MKHPHSLRGTVVGSFAVFFWGMILPLSKFLGGYLGQFTTGAAGFLAGGFLATLFLGFPRSIENKSLFGLRLFLYLEYIIFLYIALTWTAPEALPFIILTNYLWPLATVIFSIALLKIAPNKVRLSLGLGLAVFGVVIELGGSRFLEIPAPPWWCTTLAFIGSISWGFYSALNKMIGAKTGGVQALSPLMLSTGVVLGIIGMLRQEPMHIADAPLWPLLVFCIFPFFGNLCWDYGTRNGNTVILGFLADLTPWCSLVGASLFLQAPLHPSILIAGCLILLGAWVCRSVGQVARSPAR